MVLRVVEQLASGQRVELFSSGEIHGEFTAEFQDHFYFPSGGLIIFYLDVWVAGTKDEPIGLAFGELEGEVTL